MKNHLDGIVVEGERIGIFLLGMSKEVLLESLVQPYGSEKRHGRRVYLTRYMSFFVDERAKKVNQICMFKGFEGKFLTQYGIGSDLVEVDPTPENWHVDWEASCYASVKYKGIIFGLEEDAIMNEVETNKNLPIGWICIAPPWKYEKHEE
ncbi:MULTISPECIES: hypothetical protein [Priestia]|uniref:hypothetical protein n=1 Tax=Priestia TaxID=2800373 RepID=UPI000891E81B|nr:MULTISPECIES: hypothetical protein [Priestia]MCM3639848.1 hypothetical protein [Priestia aryabhattai]SDE45664.1 hypothetical protein SAMN04487777_1135 [Priestia aryabhattai B8W22]